MAKNRSQLAYTAEAFGDILHLPEGVHVSHVEFDHARYLVRVYFVSAEAKHGVWETPEGQEIPYMLIEGTNHAAVVTSEDIKW